jgi:hypothetical protein
LGMAEPPETTIEETLRRSQQIADTAGRAVAMQLRRLATNEPEDAEFWDRMWADWCGRSRNLARADHEF